MSGVAGFDALSINIYRKLLCELICHHGVRCHQYPEDSQLFISASGKLRVCVHILSRCLEAMRIWIGENRLQLNSGKTKWLGIWGLVSSRFILFLLLNGIALSQRDPMYNLVVFLDSGIMLEEQVSVMGTKSVGEGLAEPRGGIKRGISLELSHNHK